MLDETTGADIPYSMTMRAVLPAVSAATSVHVTPFSEMAASAVGTSAVDADRIRQAMATVQTMMASLGVSLKPDCVCCRTDFRNVSAYFVTSFGFKRSHILRARQSLRL